MGPMTPFRNPNRNLCKNIKFIFENSLFVADLVHTWLAKKLAVPCSFHTAVTMPN